MKRAASWLLVLALAGPAAARAEGLLLTEELQLSVAQAFLADGEHYRAVTEFRRFLILFPGSRRTAEALLGAGIAYERGEEHADAARAFARVRELAPGDARTAEAGLREGVSWWRAGERERARAVLAELRARRPGSPESARAAEALALMAVEEGDLDAAAAALAASAGEGGGEATAGERARRGAQVIEETRPLPAKSPALAGWLSAVVPGSGYLTVGRPGDAVTALAINALFVAGAVTAWHQENYPLAVLVAGVWIPFYAGNIQGSANAARRWNAGVRTDLRSRLAAVLEFAY